MWTLPGPATGLFVLACLSVASATSAETPTSDFIVFLPDNVLPESVLSEFLEARHVGDYRVVTVNADALRKMLRDASTLSAAAEPASITLPLIDQSMISIEVRSGGESHEGWKSGFATFRGRVSGDELSTAQCVIAPDGSISLLIRTAGKRYKLEKTSLLPYHVYWVLGAGFEQKID